MSPTMTLRIACGVLAVTAVSSRSPTGASVAPIVRHVGLRWQGGSSLMDRVGAIGDEVVVEMRRRLVGNLQRVSDGLR